MLKHATFFCTLFFLSTPSFAISFQENCQKSLAAHDSASKTYYDFMNGGDDFYGSHAPVSREAWDAMTDDAKCILAEKVLNQPRLTLRYPGTFSGPGTEDLSLLIGLNKIEAFECDCMMVQSYTALLNLPNLKSVKVDVFDHASGYKNGKWSVFDALISTAKTGEFSRALTNIPQYRKDLNLRMPFAFEPSRPQPNFINRDLLYRNFSKRSY